MMNGTARRLVLRLDYSSMCFLGLLEGCLVELWCCTVEPLAVFRVALDTI